MGSPRSCAHCGAPSTHGRPTRFIVERGVHLHRECIGAFQEADEPKAAPAAPAVTDKYGTPLAVGDYVTFWSDRRIHAGVVRSFVPGREPIVVDDGDPTDPNPATNNWSILGEFPRASVIRANPQEPRWRQVLLVTIRELRARVSDLERECSLLRGEAAIAHNEAIDDMHSHSVFR